MKEQSSSPQFETFPLMNASPALLSLLLRLTPAEIDALQAETMKIANELAQMCQLPNASAKTPGAGQNISG
jgi:hypothetical protein